MNIKVNMETYIEQIRKQCKKYVLTHFYRKSTNTYIEANDVVQQMLELIYQSYVSGNGLSSVIKDKKLIPSWQLNLVFLNALRKLKILHDTDTEKSQHPETVKVIFDENGEIIDYYYSSTYPFEEEEKQEKKSKVPTGRERELWLQRIRRLKERGFSDEEILKILTPIKQGVLF